MGLCPHLTAKKQYYSSVLKTIINHPQITIFTGGINHSQMDGL